MKTKVILSALAASAMFAACTNDELENIQVQDAPKTEWIALDGIEASVQIGDVVDSRLTTDGKWEATDEVGVGFVNWWNKDSQGTTNRYSEGTRHAGATAGEWANAVTSADLYANHRLYLNEGAWKFETVVYEGLHYAYYPLQNHKNVAPLKVELGDEQTFGEENAFITNGLFAVSPLYDLENDAAGKAPKASFALNTISNRLALTIELANARDITDPIVIKDVTVSAKKSSADAEIFAQAAEINGSMLPVADYTNLLTWEALADGHADKTDAKKAEAIEKDAKETAENFKGITFGAGKAIDVEYVSTMSTSVKGHTGLTSSAKTYAVNLLTFPYTTASAVDEVEVTVTTNYGSVTIAKVNNAPTGETDAEKAVREANNKKLDAIVAILSGSNDAPKGTDNNPINFTGYGKYAGTTLLLDMKNPDLSEFDIESAEDWAKAVTIAGQVGGSNLIFNVNKDVVADLTNLPASVATINVAAEKTLTISGNYANQALTISNSGKVKVAASTALTVNGTIAKPANLTIDGNVENWGDVTVGENGKLTLEGTVENHANVVNKKSLIVGEFTNNKDKAVVGNANTHDCEGIVKNYATLTINTTFTNKGTYYTIGASAAIAGSGTFVNVDGVNSPAEWTGTAITEEGGSFDGITSGVMKATVNTPAQMNAAVAAQATEITVTGVVSLDVVLSVTTNVILKDNAELYILADSKVGVEDINGANATDNKLYITVEGENTKVSATSVQDINYLGVKPAASVEIMEDTKLNILTLSYDLDSEVTNNGLVYLVTLSKNSGLWKGMAINKQVDNNGNETILPYQ